MYFINKCGVNFASCVVAHSVQITAVEKRVDAKIFCGATEKNEVIN